MIGHPRMKKTGIQSMHKMMVRNSQVKIFTAHIIIIIHTYYIIECEFNNSNVNLFSLFKERIFKYNSPSTDWM